MKEKRAASRGTATSDTKKAAAVRDGKLSKSEPKITRSINIGLSDEDREAVAGLLQGVLANTSLIYVKTRNYHWNVTGPRFHTLHLFLEAQYTALAESADAVAERVRSLGSFPIGTMAEFIENSDLKEEPGVRPPSDGMLLSLLNDHETIIRGLREDIETCEDHNDTGTADFLTGLMEEHEKMAWMLRGHLEDHELRDDF